MLRKAVSIIVVIIVGVFLGCLVIGVPMVLYSVIASQSVTKIFANDLSAFNHKMEEFKVRFTF